MRLAILASGSTGNCTLVSCGDKHLLIDAGISARRITAALRELGLAPEKIGAVLITHDHSDHIQGLRNFALNRKIPVFASCAATEAICRATGCPAESLSALEPGRPLRLDGFGITCFPTPHDAPGSLGYRISGADGTLGYATDTGTVTPEMLEGLRGTDTAVIEANHDPEMLRAGRYPPYIKERIRSPLGHLSNESCGRLAAALAGTGTKRLILAHLSRENNTPGKAREAVAAALAEAGRTAELFVAPERGVLELAWAKEVEPCWE